MGKRNASTAVLASVLALGVQAAPSQAADTVWRVVNPNADGKITASGSLTVKNAAGQELFTCADFILRGLIGGSGAPRTSPYLGEFKSKDGASCFSPDGVEWQGVLVGTLGSTNIWATGFNASTGVTSINAYGAGSPAAKWPLFIFSRKTGSCNFAVSSVTGTYTNSTSALETTTAKVGLGSNPPCPGTPAEDETITFAGEFEMTPAIEITAAAS